MLGKSLFPATLETLSVWVSGMGEKQILPKSIKLYLAGIKSFQVDMGATRSKLEVFHYPTLEQIICGICQLRGEPDTKKRLLITRFVLLAMLTTFDTRTQRGATFHAAFCLAFAGFLRMGEFTWCGADRQDKFRLWHLTRASITFKADRLHVQLPASKTDPFQQGVKIIIAATGDKACTLKSLHRLFQKFPAPLHAPLFDTDKGFTRQYVTTVLRDTLQGLGYAGNYSGHFF